MNRAANQRRHQQGAPAARGGQFATEGKSTETGVSLNAIGDSGVRTTSVPTAESVRDAIAEVNVAWEAWRSRPTRETTSAYEQSVLAAGQAVHDRAAALHDFPEPISDEKWTEHAATIAALNKEVSRVEAEQDTNPNTSALMQAYRNRRVAAIDMEQQATAAATARADAYREVLKEAGCLFGGSLPYQLTGRRTPADKKALAAAREDLQTTPRAWIHESNNAATEHGLDISHTHGHGRAHYDHGEDDFGIPERQATLHIDGKSDAEMRRTFRHEFAHRIELLNGRVHTATTEFLRRRTTRPDGVREPPEQIGDHSKGEKARRGGFFHPYVGKDYGPTGGTEVFSMGSEALWHGSHGALIGNATDRTADPEHRNLILGLYASASRD